LAWRVEPRQVNDNYADYAEPIIKDLALLIC